MKFSRSFCLSAVAVAVLATTGNAMPQSQTPALNTTGLPNIDPVCTSNAAWLKIFKKALSNCVSFTYNAAQLVLDDTNEVVTQKIRERFGIEPDLMYRQILSTQFMNIHNACAGNLNTTYKCNNDGPCVKWGSGAYACLNCPVNGYINICPVVLEPKKLMVDCFGSSVTGIFIHETVHNFGELDKDGAGKYQRLAMQLMPDCINKPWGPGKPVNPYETHTPVPLYDRTGPVATPSPTGV